VKKYGQKDDDAHGRFTRKKSGEKEEKNKKKKDFYNDEKSLFT